MKRAERQYALVDLLRGARRPWSAARLAAEFDVSPRTVERDIASLQVAGVPVYADHGVLGGYSILREYSLPPLNLSAAESLAALAGLALLESSPYQGAVRRARAKIAAVVDEEHRGTVQELLGTMHVIEAGTPAADSVPVGMLSDAIAARRVGADRAADPRDRAAVLPRRVRTPGRRGVRPAAGPRRARDVALTARVGAAPSAMLPP